jgi:hypothetical protein
MSCVTNGWQEVSARSMLPSSKRRLIGSRFNKSRQSPRDHNRRLLQQNLPISATAHLFRTELQPASLSDEGQRESSMRPFGNVADRDDSNLHPDRLIVGDAADTDTTMYGETR